LPDAAADQLVAIWDELPSTHKEMPEAPLLGYRGCQMMAADTRTWRAFGGIVVLRAGEEGQVDSRADIQRQWESRLLDTAPSGLLPPINVRP